MKDKKPILRTHVVFSAVGEPESFSVFKSLKKIEEATNVVAITASNYVINWEQEGIQVQTAKFNSLASWKKFIRKFLIRSKALRILVNRFLLFRSDKYLPVLMPPHNARHFEYQRALENLHDDDWVFLVDSRDLVFQEAPSLVAAKLAEGGDLHVFDEGDVFFKTGELQLNGLSSANWNWAQQLRNFQTEDLLALKSESILNSGCIAGRVKNLKVLMNLSCDALSRSQWSNFALLDQASLNFVAYCTELRADITFNRNGDPVLNMCGVTSGRSEIRSGELFLNEVKVPIVHQFDRFGSWDDNKGFCFNKRKYEVQVSNK
jgi:hypothetical protein